MFNETFESSRPRLLHFSWYTAGIANTKMLCGFSSGTIRERCGVSSSCGGITSCARLISSRRRISRRRYSRHGIGMSRRRIGADSSRSNRFAASPRISSHDSSAPSSVYALSSYHLYGRVWSWRSVRYCSSCGYSPRY